MPNVAPRSSTRAGLRDAVILTLAWGYLWGPVLWGQEVLFARDVRVFTMPAKRYLFERLSAGELPSWIAEVSTGLPFLADVSNQVFYPLNAILWAAPSIDAGVSWFLVVHSLGAMWAFRVLAVVLGAPGLAALGGAALYGLSGYVICITDNLTYLPAVMWVPLGLAAYARGLETGSYRYSGLSALAIAPVLLAGDIQNPLVMGLAAGLLSLAVRAGSPARPAFRVIHLGASFGLAIALAAAQILPTVQMMLWSLRASGFHLDTVTAFSFPLARSLELLAPFVLGARFPAGEFLRPELYPHFGAGWVDSVYLGVIPVLLAAIGLHHNRRQSWPWLATVLVCLALALGGNAPYFEALVDALPPLRIVRYPEKLLLWVTLGISVLAAFGIAHLQAVRASAPAHRLSRLGLWSLAGLAAAAATPLAFWPDGAFSGTSVLWATRFLPGLDHAAGYWAHLAVLGVAVAGVFLIRRARWPHRYLLAVALVDLLWMHRGHVPSAPRGLFEPAPMLLDRLAPGPGRTGRLHFDHVALAALPAFRDSEPWARVRAAYNAAPVAQIPQFPHLFATVLGRERLRPNTGVAYGVHYYNGQVSPLEPRSHFELETTWLAAYPRTVLELAGVERVITSLDPVNPVWDGLRRSGPAVSFPELNVQLLRVPSPRPFAYLGSELMVADTIGDALAKLAGAPPERVVIDSPLPPTAPAPPASAAASDVALRRPSPERIEVTVNANHGERILVVSESYFPGWKAVVNGAVRTVVRAQKRYLGIPLTPGRNQVTLTYSPGHLRLGVGISAAALAAVLLLAWAGSPPERRARGAAGGTA